MAVLGYQYDDVRGETITDFKERNGLHDVMIETFVDPINAPHFTIGDEPY